MKPHGEEARKAPTLAQALEARADARRQEAVAARAQAKAYDALAQACQQRSQALSVVSRMDAVLADVTETDEERSRVRADGQRALDHSRLTEREASLHATEARRADAEASRADAEADVSSQKAGAFVSRMHDAARSLEHPDKE
ncbi:hypothetical protein D7W79_39770 [Corallococcus exercitus]|uniref:hypothetical protein n=1 Tax=Corallococcus exercitus TaxID=2316736 RepID=UPI000EA32307|nr:hypothetical protein [Corallococcus exercitus]RKG63879.1 hypothetical protein D7W79_39770 [Corallococcus exercitus]